jgi:hypothetical protein
MSVLWIVADERMIADMRKPRFNGRVRRVATIPLHSRILVVGVESVNRERQGPSPGSPSPWLD